MAEQPTPTDFDGLVAQYGAAKEPAAPAASFDELVSRHAAPPKRNDPGPLSGPEWDSYFDADSAFSQAASPAAAHILDAFGQGAKQGWGSEPIGLSPETEQALRDHGAFNDFEKGHFSAGKALNEAVFRPVATTVEAGFRGMRAVIGGGLAAIEQTGKEIGQPRLGREAAAVGEYLTQRADVFAPTMATLAKANDLKVIGAGEGGWKGTADQVSAVEEARDRLRPSQETDEARPSPESAAAPAAAAAPTAPSAPAAPPDIHAMAREIDPGTFREYNALSQRKDTFSRWIDELRDSRDQAATADLDKQIAEQQARLDGATGKKAATYRDRLETLNDQREQALEDARAKDSPDMARIRQQLQQTDYRMRDLAPDVTKAYRAAQEHMPEEAAAPEAAAPTEAAAPAAEATTATAETAAPAEAAPAPAPAAAEAATAPHVDIAADVAQKLTAAGRPAEEANASGALYASYYEARAARLGTTAQDLYANGGPEVRAGRGAGTRVRELELAQRVMPKALEEIGLKHGFNSEEFKKAEKEWEESARSLSGPDKGEAVAFSHPGALAQQLATEDGHHPNQLLSEGAYEDAAEQQGRPANANRFGVVASQDGRLAALNAEETALRAEVRKLDTFAASIPGSATRTRVNQIEARLKALDMERYHLAHQEFAQDARGKIALKEGRAVITLFKNADASTFMHETGHMWLEDLMGDAKDSRAVPQVAKDAQTVRDWLDNDGGQITTRQHEKFARGFERYLMEGRAPTKALAGVFGQFKDWLTKIYETVAKLRAPITDDIRDVFDRLIAKEPEGRGTVVAPEREPELTLGDKHEALAEKTPPEHSDTVADTVRAEADADAKAHVPEVADEIGAGVASEARGSPPQGAEPDGNRAAPGALPGEAGGSTASRALGQGGDETSPQGAGARAEGRVGRSPFEKVPREPQRLLTFLRAAGGLKDQSGEISTILGGVNKRPGLINNKAGLTLDEAALRAWEHGFVGTKGGERPSVAEFLEAVEHDARGNPRYSAEDEAAVARHNEALNRNAEIDRLAKHYDIDHRAMSRDEFFNKLAERASFEDRAKEIQSQTETHEAALKEAEDRASEGQGDAYEPPPDRGNLPSRTLEDIDHERGQEEAASRSGSGAGVALAPRPGGARAGEASAGQRGRGAGPAGPHDPLPATESRLVDKAGNIRLDNLNTPEDVNSVIRDTADKNGGFIGARRGVISDAQVLDLADALGMDASPVLKRKLGEAFNAEQVVQARKLLIQSAVGVRDAAAKAASGADADVIAFSEAVTRHRMIQEQVSGITAEAGRALRAFRAMEGSTEAGQVADILKETTGRTLFQMRKQAQQIAGLETSAQVSGFITNANKPGLGAMTLEVFKNWLIAGPITHTTYAIGNTALALYKAVPETLAQAALGAARESVTGGGASRVRFGEVPAQLYAMFKGQRDGWRAAADSFKAGQTMALPHEMLDSLTKAERARFDSLTASGATYEQAMDRLGIQVGQTTPFTNTTAVPNFKVGSVPIPLGSIVRAPGERMVAPIHSYFRTIGYLQGVARLAYRQAADEGLIGDAFTSRVADLTRQPSEQMMAAARHEATEQTLMGKGGNFTKKITALVNVEPNLPLLGPTKPLAFIDPFVHVSANILEQSVLSRGLLGPLTERMRADMSGRNGPLAQDDAFARFGLGTSLTVVGGGLAAEGLITPSAPSDPKDAAMWRLVNGQPHSLRIGHLSIDLGHLGVLGFQMGIAADIYHCGSMIGKEDAAKITSCLVHSFTQNFLDESVMRGPSDMMKALDESDRYGAQYVRNFVSSLAVPFSVGMSQVAHQVDPYARQARTLLDAIKSKVPWWSETLMPRRDIWGEPVLNRDFAGVYVQRLKDDPVNQELMRLHYSPSQPERKIVGVGLTDQQYDDYSRISGRTAKMDLDRLVQMPGFAKYPDGVKHELISNAIKGAREKAGELVKMQSLGTANDIVAQAVKAKTEKMTGTK